MRPPADPPSAAQPPLPVAVVLPITLGQLLKLTGSAATGGEAKRLVEDGVVRVNGSVEFHRGRRLVHGDVVQTPESDFRLVSSDGPEGREDVVG